MTIAKIAYLSTPGPERFVLNIQAFGSDELQKFEITKAHMINILLDGTALALRESNQSNALKKGAIRATLRQSSDSDISDPVQNRVPNNSSQESADAGSDHRA